MVRSRAKIRKIRIYNQHLTLAKVSTTGIPELVLQDYPRHSKLDTISTDFLNSIILTPCGILLQENSLLKWKVMLGSNSSFIIHFENRRKVINSIVGEHSDVITALSSVLNSCPSCQVFLIVVLKLIRNERKIKDVKKEAITIINKLIKTYS